jgi:ABC-2 type transport system permease protein
MFFITGAAGAMLEEKETGTWNRLVACPVRNYSIIGGFTFGSLIQGWIQVGLLVIFSRFVFNINWGNSILGICLLFTCFLLAVIGLGIALSSFVKTKAQLSILSPLVVMPTCLIAGCMWPREVMPDFMQSISNFMPQTWLIKGMTDLVARGSEISAVFIPCAVLMVFAVVFFITGLTILGYRNR